MNRSSSGEALQGRRRAGLSRSEGESLTSHAWSAGVQHTPSWLGRPKDLAGVGYSFLRQPEGREQVAEAYYNVSLADCCAIIANVQWILSGPNQVSGRRNRDVVVPGLRAQILFSKPPNRSAIEARITESEKTPEVDEEPERAMAQEGEPENPD